MNEKAFKQIKDENSIHNLVAKMTTWNSEPQYKKKVKRSPSPALIENSVSQEIDSYV